MIFITSYAFIGTHSKVFRYFKNKENLTFILPKAWKVKKSGETRKPNFDEGLKVIPTKTYFHHSHYPIVGGLLKGWMPNLKNILKKRAQKGDVLYSAAEPNMLVTYLNGRIAKSLGLKHVFFTWQNIPYKTRLSGFKLKFVEWLIRKTVSISDGIICGTVKASNLTDEYLPRDFKRIILPLTGVDVERFKPADSLEFRKKYNLENKIVFSFAGAMDHRKGIATTLKAFLKASKEITNIHFVMVGRGPLREEAENFVKENNLEDLVTFINWLPHEELPTVLSSSDIFVYQSEPNKDWEEQFGYSLIEASASGLPVISTKSGSIDEVILDGKTGILIEPRNVDQLASAMIKLSTDHELRKRMSNEGRSFAVNKYSHAVVSEKMEQFLENI